MILPQTTPILPPSPLFSSLSLSLTSAMMNPFSKSVWIFPPAWGAFVPFCRTVAQTQAVPHPHLLLPPPPSPLSTHTHTQHTLNFSPSGPHHFFTPSPMHPSLGTRSLKNPKGGSGKLAGVEVYTAPGMQVHF